MPLEQRKERDPTPTISVGELCFSQVRSLWRRLKAAISKVAEKLRQVKRMLFGHLVRGSCADGTGL